ncbi:uncharacterized protein LOC110975139 isoform X3 [Acanthaster planci]|uniref:Uncharacterized protein LOC110975139 isoform X3 n=1 Tax=Acanthaster planci TaxID=133434 RepID=A0A8B7XS11_ACAPL|nr:uncharacterized protein LOC110975139 isoform X3 [Acanthaster planci]
MANGCLRKIATRDMLVGMGHEDYHCSVCHKWLDQEPRMCSDKRTCYYCYMEIQIKRPEKCPVCEETFEPDEHFVKDKRAAKDMKRSTAKCCTCGREMAMSALREHQEECGGVESLPQQIDERGPPEDHCPTQMHVDEQDPPEDPAQEEGKGSNEPIISCLYKMFGCDFQQNLIDKSKEQKVTPVFGYNFRPTHSIEYKSVDAKVKDWATNLLFLVIPVHKIHACNNIPQVSAKTSSSSERFKSYSYHN